MSAETRCATCVDAAAVSVAVLQEGFAARGLVPSAEMTRTLTAWLEGAGAGPIHESRCPLWVEWRDLKSWVYFIQCGESGPIKIGKSNDPARRLHGLQTGHHEALVLLATVRGGEPLERSLHAALVAHRLKGEWFAPHERVLGIAAGFRLVAEVQREEALAKEGGAS